jgi:nicotinate-nucleotide pyrophosphorylase (carboxylating)
MLQQHTVDDAALARIIAAALAEDLSSADPGGADPDGGDITSLATIPADARLRGVFLAKEDGVLAGLAVACRVFASLDPAVAVRPSLDDGDRLTAGQVFAEIEGPGRALLSGERVALNFMQRMSGIATATRRYVDAVAGTRAVILDTRKTAPGLRLLDKWAVRLGGAQNHRMGLYDMALIKDNHIAAVGSITEAVARVRRNDPFGRPIEVEVMNLAQLREALAIDPLLDRILLDNMTTGQMAAAVRVAAGRVPLEASGGVNLDTVAAIAATGVDYISVGALTHSVKALDISLDITD